MLDNKKLRVRKWFYLVSALTITGFAFFIKFLVNTERELRAAGYSGPYGQNHSTAIFIIGFGLAGMLFMVSGIWTYYKQKQGKQLSADPIVGGKVPTSQAKWRIIIGLIAIAMAAYWFLP